MLWAVDRHRCSPRSRQRREARGGSYAQADRALGITELLHLQTRQDSRGLQNPVVCASFPETSLRSPGNDVSLLSPSLKNIICRNDFKSTDTWVTILIFTGLGFGLGINIFENSPNDSDMQQSLRTTDLSRVLIPAVIVPPVSILCPHNFGQG